MDFEFKIKKKAYHWTYEVDYAPGFCAMQFLFDFDVNGEGVGVERWPWNSDPDEDDEDKDDDLNHLESYTTLLEAAKTCIIDAFSGSKLMLCDVVDGEMYENLILPLSTIKSFYSGKRRYTVSLSKPYRNYNSGNTVVDMTIHRIA